MKDFVSLSIPNPCREKWQDFTLTSAGGFCASCQKEVIDFTTWDEEEIRNYFKRPAQSTCGRFRLDQLKKYTASSTRPPGGTSWWHISLFSLTIALSANQVNAQEIKKAGQEVVDRKFIKMGDVAVGTPKPNLVSGIVKDEAGVGIGAVNITVKGTSFETVTDESGQFTINVPNPASDVLIISFIGYKTTEQRVNDNYYLMVQLLPDDQELLGVLIVSAPKWWTPRGMWWGIKRIFQ
jgi:hypothetical protein